MRAAILVAVMAIGTILLRFFPFLIIRNDPPGYISYLGRVLPPAIIGMLVIYCLKDVSIVGASHGVPELIAVICVVGIQILKRNSILSILSGTVVYMLITAFV